MDTELNREHGHIATHVRSFLKHRITTRQPKFYQMELVMWVAYRTRCSAESPGRVMRDLARNGEVGYTLLSRSESLYLAERVAETQLGLFKGAA